MATGIQPFDRGIQALNGVHHGESTGAPQFRDLSMFDAIPEGTLSSAEGDFMVPSLDFDMETFSTGISSSGIQGQQQQPQQLQRRSINIPESISRSNADSNHDFDRNEEQITSSGGDRSNGIQKNGSDVQIGGQCILACANMVTNQEGYIIAELKSLDLIVGIVKETVAELSELVQLQQDSTSVRCCMMITVVMYQVTELLESGCSNFLTEPQNMSSQAILHKRLSSVGFGAFQACAEEQRSWRARIVVRELNRVSELLQKIIAHAKIKTSEVAPEAASTQSDCYATLWKRLNSLVERMQSCMAE